MPGYVSTVSIAGIIFSMVISIGLPIVLMIVVKKKLHAQMGALGIGVAVFVLFALILEQMLHSIMLRAAGDALNSNLWLYALYAGLAAALFEETGRIIAMKRWMKKTLSRENAIMYGVGHGGVEAVLIVGMTCINNLISAFMVNSGQIEQILSATPEGEGKELAMQAYTTLCTTPGYEFFLAGVERIAAIVLQICLSYLIYRAVKEGNQLYYLMAYGIHFGVDVLTIILANMIPHAVLEAVLLVLVAALAVRVKGMYAAEGG